MRRKGVSKPYLRLDSSLVLKLHSAKPRRLGAAFTIPPSARSRLPRLWTRAVELSKAGSIPHRSSGRNGSLFRVSSGSNRLTSCKQEEQQSAGCWNPPRGRGWKMAAAAHPPETCQGLGPSPAPPPPCPRRPRAALLVSASQAEPPCGNPGPGPPAAPAPAPASPAARLRRVPAGEHLCTAILDSPPQSLPPRGGGWTGEGTRGVGVPLQPRGGPRAQLDRGESRKDARENCNDPEARHPLVSRPRRPPSPTHTPALGHPQSSPGGRRRPQPSWPRRRRLEGGRRSGARRRQQGSGCGGGGEGGREAGRWSRVLT